jgi:hypothetical protein
VKTVEANQRLRAQPAVALLLVRGADVVDNVAESVNLVGEPQLRSTVSLLSQQLHAGWRAARKLDHAAEQQY